MSASTFEIVADILADAADIPRDRIQPDSHAIEDLGVDSLAFLDSVFAIDKAFGIKLPIERWMQEVNEGKAKADEYFVMRNLAFQIDKIVAAKAA
jgi:acyl carrier protein